MRGARHLFDVLVSIPIILFIIRFPLTGFCDRTTYFRAPLKH